MVALYGRTSGLSVGFSNAAKSIIRRCHDGQENYLFLYVGRPRPDRWYLNRGIQDIRDKSVELTILRI